MPNPLVETKDFLTADAANLPDGHTRGTEHPVDSIADFHIQYAWDGTPSDAVNRENTAVRVTVWAPHGRVIDAQDVAAGLRARFLLWSSETCWRVDRGAGRLPGIDPDTKLPFCTFTVNVVMHATSAV